MSNRCGPGLLLAILPIGAGAQPWGFDAPIDVTGAAMAGVFHHLESSGRRNVAVSDGRVVVAWEDNRDGVPAVYVVTKTGDEAGFSPAVKVSGAEAAYEPTVVGLDSGRFLVGWEEGGHVRLRVWEPSGLGSPHVISGATSAQLALTVLANGTVFAVWSEHFERYTRVRGALLDARDAEVHVTEAAWLDPQPGAGDQQYPAVASRRGVPGLVVAWEDRRHGHTVLLSSEGISPGRFAAPRQVNELPPAQSSMYGKGTGAARIVLAAYGEGGIAAAWADKRDFKAGYDIYGALAPAGQPFGTNSRVQDGFGDAIEQWHPAIAGSEDGLIAVAWDDDRDGTSDIWLSWYEDGVWSDDAAVPGAADDRVQTHPSLVLDRNGDLHMVWVSRERSDGPTRLEYVHGRRISGRQR